MSRLFDYSVTLYVVIILVLCPVLHADLMADTSITLDFEDIIDPNVFGEGANFTTSEVNIEVIPLVPPRTNDPNIFVTVSGQNNAGCSGNELFIRNLALDFDFGSSVDSLQFCFYQGMDLINICVNGDLVVCSRFDILDNVSIGGAVASVKFDGDGRGTFALTGHIYSFKLGAEELWIDQMSATMAGNTSFYIDTHGDDYNTGLDRANAFATIQKAIDIARPYDVIEVFPGTYTESFHFLGPPITLKAVSEPPVLQAPGEIVVSFFNGEDNETIMQNFIIENSHTALFCLAGSPTLKNITAAGNNFGLKAYNNSKPNVYNCIFWNKIADVSECEVTYCFSKQSLPGLGNIVGDPMFVRPGYVDDNSTPADPCDDFYVHGDYHLKSAGWRWSEDPLHGSNWYYDPDATSRCIDAGLPSDSLGFEPVTLAVDPQNQWAENIRVNMGAYGGTAQASMAPYDHAFRSDITNDGSVDFFDLELFTQDWLSSGELIPVDISRDGFVNLEDIALLSADWGKQNQWGNVVNLRQYWPMEFGSKWISELIEGEGFTLEVTDIFDVNDITVWELQKTHVTTGESSKIFEYCFYLDEVLYVVDDANDLVSLPAHSAEYKPLMPEIMVSNVPFQLDDVELTPVRGLLASVLQGTEMSSEDFPTLRGDDVIAIYKNYGEVNEEIVSIFGRDVGPLYISSEWTSSRIIDDYLQIEQ